MAQAPGWRRGPTRSVVAALFVAALGAPGGCQGPNPAYRVSEATPDAGLPVADAAWPAADAFLPAADTGGGDLPPADTASSPGCAATPDEDGDGIGDACDNCLADPNPGQENAQETAAGQAPDSLGDACDPRPATGGDGVLFFDTFEGPDLDPGWLGERAAFSLADGDLVYDDADGDDMPEIHRAAAGDVLFVVSFTVVRWSSTAENRNVWAGVRADASGGAYRCSVRRDSGGATMLAFFAFGDLSGPAATRAEPIDLDVPYRLAARAQASDVSCTLGATSYVQRDAMTTAGSVEIRARRAAVRLHSAVAYQLGP
jgi:hypothetical protein